jgi:glycosyltransferase involved in cell wall biosynthesis
MTILDAPGGPATVFLISPSSTPCGVEMFTRCLARAVGDAGKDSWCIAAAGNRRDVRAIWRALRGAKTFVVCLPVVAWKRALMIPLLAMIFARLRGAETVVVLHEWADLHPMRRAFISAYLLFAKIILFSSPIVSDECRRSPLGRLPIVFGLMPIPPNIAPPLQRISSPLLKRIEEERAKGSVILGHFGSIYPKKQSTFVLDVAHCLKDGERRVFVVFIGGFIRASDNVEELFFAHARRLNLESSIAVSGYVESDAEIFALFDAVDVFVYSFAEGLTSRRGSVLTCLESGRPLIVNAPRSLSEFDHHPVFRNLIARGALHIVPNDAAAADFARAIDAIESAPAQADLDVFGSAWRDAAAALCGVIDRQPVMLASSVAVR